ncbi:MAG: hypothetical protein ACPHQD_13255 [Vibrio toranzoniae]|uniref:hypothetical protein n=1 Tax=Vibrio toranzoniae TaxID=1194427 RepID=UPI003C604CE2
MNWEEEHKKLVSIKQRISDLNTDLKEAKERLEQQEHFLIKAMDEVGLNNIRTGHGSVSRNTRTVYNVTDWDTYIAYMIAEGDYSLVQRRPGQKSVDDRFKEGINVPGVEPFEMDVLNIRKN